MHCQSPAADRFPHQMRNEECPGYFWGGSGRSGDGAWLAPVPAGAATPLPIAGPFGVPWSVVVPSAPPVSVLPVALEPDVGDADVCAAPVAGPLGVPLSVVVASAPPVSVLPVSFVGGVAVCAPTPLPKSPATSHTAAARLREMSTTTSEKSQRSCAAPWLPTDYPIPEPDNKRHAGQTPGRGQSFVAESPQTRQQAVRVDFVQTLCVGHRLVCFTQCNK